SSRGRPRRWSGPRCASPFDHRNLYHNHSRTIRSQTMARDSTRPGQRPSGDAPKPPTEKNYITPAGYRRLTEELDFLRAKKRPEVVSALADAAAEGDRSENAEYIYRKRQLRDIDRRLRFLSKRLDHVVVVDPREQKRRDRVFFGATVTVEDDAGET